MTKKKLKKFFVIVMIAVFTVSYIMPKFSILAKAQTNQIENKFGPESFQNTMEQFGANIVIIDSYAKDITEKQLPQLDSIQSIGDSLRNDINRNLKDAKNNADYWLIQLKPNIRRSVEHIVNFNDTFQLHYQNLFTAIEQKDNQKLEVEIEQLYKDISNYNQQVRAFINELISFRDQLSNDVKSFKSNSEQLQINLSTSNADIPLMKKQIDYYNRVIDTANGKIATGSLLCCAGILCLVGGPMIKKAVDEKEDAEEQIANLEAKISGIEKEIIILTDIQNKLTNMANTVGKAVDSLQHVSNHWHTMAAKYSNLLDNITIMDPQDFKLLKEDLLIAKTSWEQLKEFSDKLNEGLKQDDVVDRVDKLVK